MTQPPVARRRRMGLTGRLVGAFGLVVATGVVTAWLVAALVAPRLFTVPLPRAGMGGAGAAPGMPGMPGMPGGGGSDPAAVADVYAHVEEAFRSTGAISLAVAMVAAVVAAVAVGVVLARRVARSLRPVTAAAAAVAAGSYRVRVPPPGLGEEFEELVATFNDMAGRLDRVEETRRQLLGDLAHELRTPVATLGAYLEALEDGVAALDAESLAVLRAQVARLSRLAEDVAAVSRAQEGPGRLHRRPAAVGELVGTACAAVQDRFTAKGVDLTQDCPPGLPELVVDAERIGQVLGNLLDNALRHTPAGGRVEVLADAVPDVGAGSAGGPQPGVRIRVRDSGAGIAAEHLPHLFERFYRADSARDRDGGGSGIGLAIVEALVGAHGGRVSAASPGPGRGATFTVLLPASAVSPASPDGPDGPDGPDAGRPAGGGL